MLCFLKKLLISLKELILTELLDKFSKRFSTNINYHNNNINKLLNF